LMLFYKMKNLEKNNDDSHYYVCPLGMYICIVCIPHTTSTYWKNGELNSLSRWSYFERVTFT
jgi:hypothetical protein